MEVDFTPEQEAQLARLAINAGTDVHRLVKDAALHMLETRTIPRVAEMRALRSRIQPDPDGWSTPDYVPYGRP